MIYKPQVNQVIKMQSKKEKKNRVNNAKGNRSRCLLLNIKEHDKQ